MAPATGMSSSARVSPVPRSHNCLAPMHLARLPLFSGPEQPPLLQDIRTRGASLLGMRRSRPSWPSSQIPSKGDATQPQPERACQGEKAG